MKTNFKAKNSNKSISKNFVMSEFIHQENIKIINIHELKNRLTAQKHKGILFS